MSGRKAGFVLMCAAAVAALAPSYALAEDDSDRQRDEPAAVQLAQSQDQERLERARRAEQERAEAAQQEDRQRAERAMAERRVRELAAQAQPAQANPLERIEQLQRQVAELREQLEQLRKAAAGQNVAALNEPREQAEREARPAEGGRVVILTEPKQEARAEGRREARPQAKPEAGQEGRLEFRSEGGEGVIVRLGPPGGAMAGAWVPGAPRPGAPLAGAAVPAGRPNPMPGAILPGILMPGAPVAGAPRPTQAPQRIEAMMGMIQALHRVCYEPGVAAMIAVGALKEDLRRNPEEAIRDLEGALRHVRNLGLRNAIHLSLKDLYKARNDTERAAQHLLAMIEENDRALPPAPGGPSPVAEPTARPPAGERPGLRLAPREVPRREEGPAPGAPALRRGQESREMRPFGQEGPILRRGEREGGPGDQARPRPDPRRERQEDDED